MEGLEEDDMVIGADNNPVTLRRVKTNSPVLHQLRLLHLKDSAQRRNVLGVVASSYRDYLFQCLRVLKLADNVLSTTHIALISHGLSSTDCALENLSLANCQISSADAASLFRALYGNTTLRTLELQDNEIEELPSSFPEIVGGFHFTRLYLQGNKLSSLPLEFLRGLDSSVQLNIEGNRIDNLPLEITRFRRGSVRVVGEYVQRKDGIVTTRRNALEELGRGTKFPSDDAVFNYLKQLSIGTRPINEARIFVVGPANVGKSTLLRMMKPLSDRVWQSLREWIMGAAPTVGVDIEALRATVKGQEVTMHVWDCGGQGSYYAGHQLFMSEHTVAVMVFRIGMEGLRQYMAQWIDNIRCKCGGAGGSGVEMMLVGTHLDEIAEKGWFGSIANEEKVCAKMHEAREIFDKEWEVWELRERQRERGNESHSAASDEEACCVETRSVLHDRVYAVNATKGRVVKIIDRRVEKVKSLKRELAIVVLQLCGGQGVETPREVPRGHIPATYVMLRQRLIEENRIKMTVDEIWGTATGFSSKQELKYALEFLKQIGVLVWFQEVQDISDHVFLFSSWVKDVVMLPLSMYHLLYPDREVCEDDFDFSVERIRDIRENGGMIIPNWFPEIFGSLARAGYGTASESSCKNVIRLLEAFGLANMIEGMGCFVPMLQCYRVTQEGSTDFLQAFRGSDIVERTIATCETGTAVDGELAYEHGAMAVCIVRHIRSAELLQLLSRIQAMDKTRSSPRMWVPPPVEEAVGAVQKGKPAAVVIMDGAVRLMMVVSRKEDAVILKGKDIGFEWEGGKTGIMLEVQVQQKATGKRDLVRRMLMSAKNVVEDVMGFMNEAEGMEGSVARVKDKYFAWNMACASIFLPPIRRCYALHSVRDFSVNVCSECGHQPSNWHKALQGASAVEVAQPSSSSPCDDRGVAMELISPYTRPELMERFPREVAQLLNTREHLVVNGKLELLGGDSNIGAGHFGGVQKGVLDATESVAVKFLKKIDMQSAAWRSYVTMLLNEAEMMRKMSHCNVLTCHGVDYVNDNVCMVTELMQCSLERWIRARLEEHTPRAVLHDRLHVIALSIARGCKHVVDNNVVHADLKPDNILVSERPDGALEVKLADFGLSKEIHVSEADHVALKVEGLPVLYSPLEVLQCYEFSEASDVYSYSTMLFELFNDMKHPFEAIRGEREMIDHLNGDSYYPPSPPVVWNEIIRGIVTYGMQKDKHARRSFAWIIEQLSKIQGT